jgi:hypothetical protein
LGNSESAAIILCIRYTKASGNALLDNAQSIMGPVQGLKGSHRPEIGIN